MHPLTAPLPASRLPAPSPERSVVAHLQQAALFRDYQAAYEDTTGLPLALRALGSFRSPMHESKQVNPFCALLAASNQACAACLRQQQAMEDEATTDARTTECFAGLTESAVPVRVGETVIGHLQTGQVLMRQPTKVKFKQILERLREFGAQVDAAALEAAYFQTRVVGRTQYGAMVRLLAVFAQHLGSVSNRVMVQETAAEPPAVVKARAFIAAHMADDISLKDVARASNMSEFYFCKVFRKTTGLTFTSYLARTRIEAVKTSLLNPHMRVSEAAFAAGFQSLSQFNRVFRRVEGESPSSYRDRLHPPTGRNLPHAA